MSTTRIPVEAIKGRGSATQLAHRFSRDERDAWDDGWDTLVDLQADRPAQIRTQIHFEDAKSVISRNDSPDIPFDASINPYRGCEHVIPTYFVCVKKEFK